MKQTAKIVVLIALAIVLTLPLTSCRLAASQPPAATPTGDGLPFPVGNTPGSMDQLGTQTAQASTPLPVQPTETAQVLVATETPGSEQPQGGDQQPQPTTDPNAGGGQTQAGTNPTPVVARPADYTLKKGEWPICIARRFDLDIDTFFQANGLNMNSKPAAGTTLRIPATGTWDSKFGARSLRQHPVDYTVVAGDSLYSIACKFGDVTPEAILAVNGFSSENDIKVGSTIRVP